MLDAFVAVSYKSIQHEASPHGVRQLAEPARRPGAEVLLDSAVELKPGRGV